MSDGTSRDEPSADRGGVARLLRSLAVGAAVAVAFVGGRKLLDRRRAGADDGQPDGGTKRASSNDTAADATADPPDLATELRGAAEELAVTLLDRATDHLERNKHPASPAEGTDHLTDTQKAPETAE